MGRVRNCLDAHLGQIVCDKDGVVDWCIVLILWPINSGVLTSLLLTHLSSSLTDSLSSLNLLCHSKTDVRFMQSAPKTSWRISYVSVAFFPSLKHNFIAYRSSKVSSRPDCIFEIHQLWQSGFSRMYSNCYCSSSFEPGIIKIGQSSHKIYSNNSEFSMLVLKSLEPYWSACSTTPTSSKRSALTLNNPRRLICLAKPIV